MNGTLRSKQGCWTCRLRRKKCDERRPSCSTCEALTITCYGYGSKPDWMDNGEEEKAMANSIKEIVKHTSRRKGRLGVKMSRFQERYMGQKRDNSEVWIAPKSIDTSSGPSPSSGPESTGGPRAADSDSNSPAQSSGLGRSASPVRCLNTIRRQMLTQNRAPHRETLMQFPLPGCRLKFRAPRQSS